jgi:CheY-like chemotaxis protein
MQMPRVLVVDDEPDVVTMFTHALEGEHFEVVTAYDGIAAIDIAESDHPDVILLDIMMPMMSGYEVLQQLRTNPQTQRIPVICVTSAHSDEAREGSKAAGAQALLVKPFKPAELIAQIRRILARSQGASGAPSQN